MTEQEVILTDTGEIVDLNELTHRSTDLKLLDVYGDTPLSGEEPRVDALATISAGYRERGESGPGRPVVSRDGTIYISDPRHRAPGLRAALEARAGKALTVAFPYDNPSFFVQERFVQYSATHLLAWGDEREITVFAKNRSGEVEQRTYDVGTPEYEAARKDCKVSTSVYFMLARWTDTGPQVVFPDGLGLYRLRTTSRNSLRNLRGALRQLASFTSGQIRGIPLDIGLDYRDVAGPDGSRRTVPVWTWTLRPPQPLTSTTFAPTVARALAEGSRLQVSPPAVESLALAAYEGLPPDLEEPDPDDFPWPRHSGAIPGMAAVETPETAAVEQMADGDPPADARAHEAAYFSVTRGTYLAETEGRARFLRAYTGGETASLAAYLAGATEREAVALVTAAAEAAQVERTARERVAVYGDAPLREVITVRDDDIPRMSGEELPDLGSPVAPPVDAPADDRTRRDYGRLLAYAARLGLDTAGFEIGPESTQGQVEQQGARLKKLCQGEEERRHPSDGGRRPPSRSL